jgi:hypothetical protein
MHPYGVSTGETPPVCVHMAVSTPVTTSLLHRMVLSFLHPLHCISLVPYNPNGIILPHIPFVLPQLHPLTFYITTLLVQQFFPTDPPLYPRYS